MTSGMGIGDVVLVVDPHCSSNGRFGTVAGCLADGRLSVRFNGWKYESFRREQLVLARSMSISRLESQEGGSISGSSD